MNVSKEIYKNGELTDDELDAVLGGSFGVDFKFKCGDRVFYYEGKTKRYGTIIQRWLNNGMAKYNINVEKKGMKFDIDEEQIMLADSVK